VTGVQTCALPIYIENNIKSLLYRYIPDKEGIYEL